MNKKSRENACVQKQDATSGRMLPNCEFWERLCVLCSYTRCLLDLVPLSLWCTMGSKRFSIKILQVLYSTKKHILNPLDTTGLYLKRWKLIEFMQQENMSCINP